MTGTIAWVGLGSNLANPINQVLQAFIELDQIPRTRLIKQSALYESEPFGPVEQDNFINAVAALETALSPIELLDQLQAIEALHHRERKVHWGPRTLDLDILLFGNEQLCIERLNVPHPYLAERNFVLYPLLALEPELTLPSGIKLQALQADCHLGNLKQLSL